MIRGVEKGRLRQTDMCCGGLRIVKHRNYPSAVLDPLQLKHMVNLFP